MKPNRIRPLAICLFSRNGRILAAEGYDPTKQQMFYRPLGGAIEFGETSAATVVRELREELDAAVVDLRYLGTLENIFLYDGRPGHEIVLVYDGRFADESLYAAPALDGHEDSGVAFRAVWLEISALRRAGAPPIYPEGVLDLLP
jgi:8-oxo-dGTP pyrophosphatase MutT (NUDIX family)